MTVSGNHADSRTTANAECVALFERYLAKAQRGNMGAAIVVTSDDYVHAHTERAGADDLLYALAWGLRDIEIRLHAYLAQRHKKQVSEAPAVTADLACYNVSEAPACYDFLVWLAIAEARKRKAGITTPLRVTFAASEEEMARLDPAELAKRSMFYQNVVFPALELYGAIRDDNPAQDATPIECYTFKQFVDWGHAPPVPTVPPLMRQRVGAELERAGLRSPITITLREADWTPERNSDLTTWIKVAEWLQEHGEQVLFVRDTAQADEPITGHKTFPPASVDLHARAALYELAQLNLFVSNGPWTLAVMGLKPWAMWVNLDSANDFFPETVQFWKTWHGIDPVTTSNFPWSGPNQRICWEAPTFESIIKHIQNLPCMDHLRAK